MMALAVGPLQAHGLVLCVEKDGTQNLEFKNSEAECDSCPQPGSDGTNRMSEDAHGDDCGCTDVQAVTDEQTYKQISVLESAPLTLFLEAILPKIVFTIASKSSKPFLHAKTLPGIQRLSRTVILLI
jgi:hypothetical protein